MVSDAVIEKRIKARAIASEVRALLDVDEFDPVEFLRYLSDTMLPKAPPLEPPKSEPLCRLAAWELPFGKYAGQRLDNVEPDYLDWLCRSMEDSLKHVRDYLKHPDVRADDFDFDEDA